MFSFVFAKVLNCKNSLHHFVTRIKMQWFLQMLRTLQDPITRGMNLPMTYKTFVCFDMFTIAHIHCVCNMHKHISHNTIIFSTGSFLCVISRICGFLEQKFQFFSENFRKLLLQNPLVAAEGQKVNKGGRMQASGNIHQAFFAVLQRRGG